MKNITVIEKSDFEKIDYALGGFLFGNGAWLAKISTYAFGMNLPEEIRASDKVLHAREEDLKQMNTHVAAMIEDSKKRLKEANQKVIESIEILDKFNRVKALLDKQPSFQDAINALIETDIE